MTFDVRNRLPIITRKFEGAQPTSKEQFSLRILQITGMAAEESGSSLRISRLDVWVWEQGLAQVLRREDWVRPLGETRTKAGPDPCV